MCHSPQLAVVWEYASDIRIYSVLILRVVPLPSSIYSSLLYAAVASCSLLFRSSVVLKKLLIYLHFLQCVSPFFIQYCSVFILLMCRLYFCIFAVIFASNVLMFVHCFLPRQCRLHIVDLLVWCFSSVVAVLFYKWISMVCYSAA